MFADKVNAALEVVGGGFYWASFFKLVKDKEVKGVYIPTTAFFSVWGLWNLYYFTSLQQWASLLGGIFLVLGNMSWVVLAVYYGYRSN